MGASLSIPKPGFLVRKVVVIPNLSAFSWVEQDLTRNKFDVAITKEDVVAFPVTRRFDLIAAVGIFGLVFLEPIETTEVFVQRVLMRMLRQRHLRPAGQPLPPWTCKPIEPSR